VADSSSTKLPPFGPYDSENPPPLAFHEWAELSAKLSRRSTDERLQILQRSELTPTLFEACNTFWLGALAEQIAQDNLRLARVYAGMCVEEMKTRQAQSTDTTPDTSKNEALAITDGDGTALLVALPDRTALPFRAPKIGEPPPPQEPANLPDTPTPKSGEETQLVPALRLNPDALPFRRNVDGSENDD